MTGYGIIMAILTVASVIEMRRYPSQGTSLAIFVFGLLAVVMGLAGVWL